MDADEVQASITAVERASGKCSRGSSPLATALSRVTVYAALAEADAAFRRSWRVIELLLEQKCEEGSGQAIVNFQRELLAPITALEGLYRRIKQEEKRLIRRKSRLNAQWFASRMRVLARYLVSIKDTLAVGRAMGDGFAWYFYERDRPLVLEHLRHQQQKLLPAGVGALGERLIVENIPSLGGKFLLYHGITTFLRIGDVSVVDLSTLRVDCVGEIKTEQLAANEYAIHLELISGDLGKLPKLPSNVRQGELPWKPSPAIAGRRDRQIRQMGKVLGRIGKDKARESGASMQSDFHFAELDDVVARSRRRRVEYVQAGPAMVIGAVRQLRKGEGLADLFSYQRRKADHLVRDAPTWAMRILVPGISDNSLQLGGLGCGADTLVTTPEALPLIWWPANPETLRQILFGEVLVMTMYNPAHLWDRLRRSGFELQFDARGRLKRGVRKDGKRREEIENFDYVHRLIQHSLMTLDSVSAMIEESLRSARETHADGVVRVEIRPTVSRKIVPRGAPKPIPTGC